MTDPGGSSQSPVSETHTGYGPWCSEGSSSGRSSTLVPWRAVGEEGRANTISQSDRERSHRDRDSNSIDKVLYNTVVVIEIGNLILLTRCCIILW